MSFWKSPSSNINYSEDIWHCFGFVKFEKTVAKYKNRNRKTIKEQKLTWTYLALTEAHLDGPTLLASPQGHARLLPSASRQRRGVARACGDSATSCFAVSRSPSTQPRTWRRLEALSPLPHSLHSLPLLCPFSSSRPRATELAAAARLTTVPPSPSHCAKKLRRFVLDVPTEPRVARSPERPHRRGHLQPSVAKIAGARSSPSTPPPSR